MPFWWNGYLGQNHVVIQGPAEKPDDF